MALINPGTSLCSLCERVLHAGGDHIGMSDGLPFAFSDYADSAMHRDCFKAWPLAGELISAFNAEGQTWAGRRVQMLEDGTLADVGDSPSAARL